MRHILSIALLLTTFTTQAQRTVCDMSDLEREGYKGKVQYIIKTTKKFKEVPDDPMADPKLYLVSTDTISYSEKGTITHEQGSFKFADRSETTPTIYNYTYNNSGTAFRVKGFMGKSSTWRGVSRKCISLNVIVEYDTSSFLHSKRRKKNTYLYEEGILVEITETDPISPGDIYRYFYETNGNVKKEIFKSRGGATTTTYNTLSRDKNGNSTSIKKVANNFDACDIGQTSSYTEHITLQYIYYP